MADAAHPSHEYGPGATERALTTAWQAVDTAGSVVLVEGVSDQIAIEIAAERLGHDLATTGVLVMPIGGAQAVARTVAELTDRVPHVQTSGMCDVGEVGFFRRSLAEVDVAVCVDDLEDELIRAAGPERFEAIIDDLGELRAFRTLQAQGPWRAAPHAAQAHRFIRSRAGRGQRYAVAVLQAIEIDEIPEPLRAAVERSVH